MTATEHPTAVTTKDSPRSFRHTVDRLVGLIDARQMRLFAVIDQAAEARNVGLGLRPTTLVVFGNPTAGTAVMDAAPSPPSIPTWPITFPASRHSPTPSSLHSNSRRKGPASRNDGANDPAARAGRGVVTMVADTSDVARVHPFQIKLSAVADR